MIRPAFAKCIAASSVFIIAFLSVEGPALACSDLPNICGQAQEHYRNMLDIAATPPFDDYAEYDAPPDYSAAEWQTWSEEDFAQPQVDQQRLAAYQSFLDGEWFYKDASSTAPGQYCVATFMRNGVGAMILGPGGGYPNAFLAFFGPDIPRSSSLRKVKVTLKQTGEAAQTLNVFNTTLPGIDSQGMLIFAVPSLQTALDGMLDKHRFEISLKKKTVADIEWHGGKAARKKLRNCASAAG